MRSLVNRKINQEPVRSPSPDIANRNIIFHTTAPEVKAILSKSRTKMPEPSKFSFNNSNEDVSNRLSELQENYRRLEAELNGLLFQNSAFKKENSAMKKENAELKDLLDKNKLGFLRLVDQPQPGNNFKEYEMRISRFSSEIKRIQELLIRQKQKNQLLESQILKFKNYEQRYSKPSFQSDLHTSSFKFIEESLNGNFERLKAEQELKLHLSLNSLNQRLKEIEKIQITIKSRAYKQNEYQTPKGKKYVQKQDYSTGSDYLAGSIELKKFQRSGRHPQDEREIDFLKDKLRLNQFQLEDAKRENIRLKQQLTKGQERASGAEECAQCKIYIDRIGQLQREIVRFNLITGENKGNQYRGDEILTKNEEERNRNELNSFYINKIQILQRENQALRLLREQEAIESQSRAIHEQEKRSISLTLEDYLGRIKDLKSILSSQQFKDFLSKINVLIDENSNFRAKAVKLDQLNRANRQAKDKQIQLRRLVAQLKRQNGVLKAEVEQTKEQTAKLNEIIDQQIKYQQSKNHFSINEQQLQSVQPDTAKFQRSLYQAVERLQSIQKSISNQISHKEIA